MSAPPPPPTAMQNSASCTHETETRPPYVWSGRMYHLPLICSTGSPLPSVAAQSSRLAGDRVQAIASRPRPSGSIDCGAAHLPPLYATTCPLRSTASHAELGA